MNDAIQEVPYPKQCESMDHQPTILARLAMRRKSLENEMARVDEALALVGKNPEVERTLSALTKVLGSHVC